MSAEDREFPERTNWCQSVGGVLLHDNRVLLTRHTYGPGKGKLIIPGGYVLKGESPEQALVRNFSRKPASVSNPWACSAFDSIRKTGM